MTNEPMEHRLERLGEDERWEVLARYAAGESDAEEAEAIRRWLAADPARSLPETLARAIRRLSFEAPADVDVDSALARVVGRMAEPEVVPLRPAARVQRDPWYRNVWLRAAAIAILVLGGTLVVRAMTRRGAAPAVALTFEAPVGRADTVGLADGTQVILAPDSRLVVAAAYGEAERGVELDGQALFRVRHDAAKPFRVRSGEATIEDLGTTFSVRNDAGEIRVAVTEGSVRVVASTAATGVVLGAGDLAVLSPDGTATESRGAVSEEDLAWTQGRLVFRDATLSEVRSELRRWYGLELRVDDPALEQRHLTATFDGESAEEVLKVIGLSIGADIRQEGNVAVVRAGTSR